MRVFYGSPWIPAEWISAHGLQPCATWTWNEFGHGNVSLSAGTCAFAEASLRFVEAHSQTPAIFATTCDQMRRSFDALNPGTKAHTFLFNFPATWQSRSALMLLRSEIERLGRFLQSIGGHAPTRDALVETFRESNRARQHLEQIRTTCPADEYASAIARFHRDHALVLQSTTRQPERDGVPIAIVGGPISLTQQPVLTLIENVGARIVLNATKTGERSLLPEFPLDNFCADPAEAVARFYFDNCVAVFQRPNTRMYSWLKERILARYVRGIILWLHVSCDLWRAEAQSLREAFQLPVLIIEADDVETGSSRSTSRIQAFLEMLA